MAYIRITTTKDYFTMLKQNEWQILMKIQALKLQLNKWVRISQIKYFKEQNGQ